MSNKNKTIIHSSPKFSNILKFSWSDLWSKKSRTLTSLFGIFFGVFILLLVISFGLGIKRIVLQDIMQDLPVDMIEVTPKKLDWGFVKTNSFFGSDTITQANVRTIREFPEVKNIYPRLKVPLPFMVRCPQIHKNLAAELVIDGVPQSLINDPDFVPSPLENAKPVATFKGFVNPKIVQMANSSFGDKIAEQMGVSEVSPTLLKGLSCNVHVGRGMLMSESQVKQKGMIVGGISGVSPWAMGLGITMPIESARKILGRFAKGYSENHDVSTPFPNETYGSIIVQAKSVEDLNVLHKKITENGWSISDTSKKTERVLNTATTFLGLFGLLLLVMASINITHTFFSIINERKKEMGVMRAIGIRSSSLTYWLLGQAFIMAMIAGLIGIISAFISTYIIDAFLLWALPKFPFKPDSFFQFPMWLILLGLMAALISAFLGAILPAFLASRAKIIDFLKDA